jgi:hypothetical protein
MADVEYVAVRAKRALLSNDQRQLLVLEGTHGGLIAVEGSVDRPRFRVVFATAVMLGADVPSEAAPPNRRGDGLQALGIRAVRVQPWAEILVGVEDVALDPILDAFAADHRASWPPSLSSVNAADGATVQEPAKA